MNKLICSFKSDLPNEIDFAMQVATLLANTDNFTWSRDFPLVDAICSGLHVFTCVCDGDRLACYCYPRFWHRILIKHRDNEHLQAATAHQSTDPTFLKFDHLEDHEFKDQQKIYWRIRSTAELIKQFSLTIGIENNENCHETKKKKLQASPSLLKFVSLLLHCDDAPLNLIGLSILTNCASKLSKLPDKINDPCLAKLVQMFVEVCVDSICRTDGDIYIINSSLEVVSRLISSSSRQVSSSIINQITERNLVLRIEQFLTSHNDVTLFLSSLECCYRISRYHPHLLSGRTRYLNKIILSLLNFDDSRHFTPSALKRIKLIDEDESAPIVKPIVMNTLQPISTTTTSELKRKQPAVVKPIGVPTTHVNATKNNDTNVNNVATLNSTSKPTTPAEGAPAEKEYTCEWNGCGTRFREPKQVQSHIFNTHIEPLAIDSLSTCLWCGPNGLGPGCLTKRPKYSLLTHLNDFHCNPVALERAANHSPPVKPPEHPGYSANAALLAIRRHANTQIERTSQRQSPLSVSVRLTAALILRNLALQSSEVKQALESHEPLLSEICMANGRDESKIIAECLSLISGD